MNRADVHRLASLLRASVSALSSAFTEASKATVEAIGENTKATNRAYEPKPPGEPERVSAEVHLPPAELERYYANQDQSYRLQRRIFWATFGTLIAVAVYAAITYAQWRTMNATNKQTVDLFKLSNRPWVGTTGDVAFEDPGLEWVGKRPDNSVYRNTRRVRYHIRNFGNGPALNVLLIAQPLTFSQSGGSNQAQIKAVIEAACQIADQRMSTYGGDLLLPTGEESVPFQFGNADPTQFLFALGCIVYRDGDGGIHHTRICHAAALFLTPEPKTLESCQQQSAN